MENGQQEAKGGGWETSKEIIAVVQATEESWLDQGFGVALKGVGWGMREREELGCGGRLGLTRVTVPSSEMGRCGNAGGKRTLLLRAHGVGGVCDTRGRYQGDGHR